jgi:hypothetical protein
MMALELLAGLEAWLQEPLEREPTLLWNYPTISALATYLAHGRGQTNRQSVHDSAHTQPLSPNANGLTPDKTRLSTLSDNEIAQLLAQEIKASRIRRAG